jgi:gamma-glutamylaminecyclotransferase
MFLLFVYGSLKRGFKHHDVLAGSECAGVAVTAAGYRLALQGEYPALVATGGEGRVRGELYRVSAELLTALDEFEGCPELYQRVSIDLEDGRSALAYVIAAARAEALTLLPGDSWVGP